MSVETRFGGAAAASTIFSDIHHDGDTFRVPLTLLTTMEEAIARHATDVGVIHHHPPPARSRELAKRELCAAAG
jgi:hypothetical protein